jgi:hypothetical protein
MSNILRFLIFIILISCGSCGSQKRIGCPITSGIISLRSERGAELAKPTRFVNISGGKEVYSSLNGVVELVFEENSKVHCSIKSGKFTLGYGNFSECLVREGEFVKKGQLLGYLNEGESLQMSVREKNKYLQPESLLKCNVVNDKY